MRLMRANEIEAIDTMKHWVEYEKSNKEKIKNADELIQMQETILDLVDNLERHLMEFYEGEMYTAKQLKNMEKSRDEYYIRKDVIKDFITKKMKYLMVDSCAEDSGKYTAYRSILNLLEGKDVEC